MIAHLTDDLMRAYQTHGLDGRPLDRNAAHLLDLRNARREADLAAEDPVWTSGAQAQSAQTPSAQTPRAAVFRRHRLPRFRALLRALASLRPTG